MPCGSERSKSARGWRWAPSGETCCGSSSGPDSGWRRPAAPSAPWRSRRRSGLPVGRSGCTATARGSTDCTLPADGFLLNRLEAYAFPLPLDNGYLETLARWAEEQRPARLAEIQTLTTIGARVAVALRTKNEILGVLLLGSPAGREEYSDAERHLLRGCAAQFALMIENGRLTSRIVEQEKLRRDLAL